MWTDVVIACKVLPLYPQEHLHKACWTFRKSSPHNNLAVKRKTNKLPKTIMGYLQKRQEVEVKPYRLMVDVCNCSVIRTGSISEGVAVKALDIFHNLIMTKVEYYSK